MNKDILLSIQGLHFTSAGDNDSSPVEVITPGQYYNKNGKHYIIYEEFAEDSSGNTRTRIKISDKQVEITKHGNASTKLLFEKGKKNLTCYNTPYGGLMFGIFTNNIQFHEAPGELSLEIDYLLEANYEPMAECNLKLHVTENASALFHNQEESS